MSNHFDIFSNAKKEPGIGRALLELKSVEYEYETHIMKKGEESDFLMIVYSGEVGIYINGKYVTERRAPDMIGESALHNNMPRTADVLAHTDPVKVILLYRESYESALNDFKNK
jgi:CRP-like cAMP-binding protein